MPSIKLLTLNLHCLEEELLLQKQHTVVHEILTREIDIVFLQEVAQLKDSPLIYENIKESNYGYTLQQLLKQQGKEYFYYFTDIKLGFNKYDEGIAILSKYMLRDVKSNYISKTHDYHNWKTRKMIKGELHLPDKTISLVSTHLGWTDENEVFEDQLERTLSHLDTSNIILLAGDFNVSPTTLEYSSILKSGLYDLYGSNPKYLLTPTHKPNMDIHEKGSRIDYIFSNLELEVLRRELLFQKRYVSDHFGVYLELKL